MFNSLKKISLFTVLILFFINSNAQVNDAQMWTDIGVIKKINKKFKIELQQSLRLRQNVTQVDKYFTDFGVKYSLNKKIQFGASYRFEEEKRLEEYFSIRHRASVDASYKQKINNLTLRLRTRFQAKYYDFHSSKAGSTPENHVRIRLKASYKFAEFPVTPNFATEFYYATKGVQKKNIDKYRFTLGGKYKINKRNTVALSYRLQKQINVSNPLDLHILILAYEYDF